MLKPGVSIELDIVSYGSEGQGVGRCDGMAVFVPFALAGEKVSVIIEKITPSYAVGRLTDIIVRSPDRMEPPCKCFSDCGGCDLMHMSYAEQLRFKTSRVADALKRIGGFDGIVVKPCIGSENTLRYRNKAVFSFAQESGRVVSGCIAEGSHRVVPTGDCLIQSETAVKVLGIVTEWANDNRLTAYDERTGKGCLRHLMVRTTSLNETMVVIVSKEPIKFANKLVDTLMRRVDSFVGLINNINPNRTNLIMGRTFNLLFGRDTVQEEVLSSRFSIGAESFLQVNHSQMCRLYSAAIDALAPEPGDDVMDLYCGTGTITLAMAKKAGTVTGIECVRRAIDDAKASAARNGITNAEFIVGEAETVLPRLVREGRRANKLLLDPPRKGAARAALEAIAGTGTERIVYVSCDPATLARDCRILAGFGYGIGSVQPVDMFPNTSHVETVVLLRRKNIDDHLEFMWTDEEFGDHVRTKKVVKK
ncbi:MAG: 23S rRNA (uracil(1939)-C(5))-methyltransferase RlmD [Clostridia bacterium]|nr:23S rRNA (uracil(1939)-C(5))-methyltransferase RlmD [Clostridia bacterium]